MINNNNEGEILNQQPEEKILNQQQEEKENTSTKITPDNLTAYTNIFIRLIESVQKFGMKKILKAFSVFLIFIVLMLLYNIVNNDKVTNIVIKKLSEQHTTATEQRKEASPSIRYSLSKLQQQTKADRAFVIELHNGVSNPTGLPFLYGEMTYEEMCDSCTSVSDEFSKLNVGNYELFDYMYCRYFFYGTIEQLKEIDKKIASKFESNNIKYVALIIIKSNQIEIGFIGITYSTNQPAIELKELRKLLLSTTFDVQQMLNYTK